MNNNIIIKAILIPNPAFDNFKINKTEIEVRTLKFVCDSFLDDTPNYMRFKLEGRIDYRDLYNMQNYAILIDVTIQDYNNKIYHTILVPEKIKIAQGSQNYELIPVTITGTGYFTWRLRQENNLNLLFSAGFDSKGVLPVNIVFNKNLFLFLKDTISEFIKTYYGDFVFNFYNDKETQSSTTLENIIISKKDNNYEMLKEYIKSYNPIIGSPLFWIDDIFTMSFNFDEIITAKKSKGQRKVFQTETQPQVSLIDITDTGLDSFEFYKKQKADYLIKYTPTVKLLKSTKNIAAFRLNQGTFDRLSNLKNLYTRFIDYSISTVDLDIFKKLTEKVAANVQINSYLFDVYPVLDFNNFNISQIFEYDFSQVFKDKTYLSEQLIIGIEFNFERNITNFTESTDGFLNKFSARKKIKTIDITSIEI